jgi:hypothetical protein
MKKLILFLLLIPFVVCASPLQQSYLRVIASKIANSGGGTEIPTPTARWQFNNNLNDTGSTYNLTNSGTVTYDATNKAEGSHAAIFDNNIYAYHADNAAFEPGAGDWSLSVVFRATYLVGSDLAIVGKYVWDEGRSGFSLRTEVSDSSALYLAIHTNDYSSTEIDVGWSPTIDTLYHVVISINASEPNEVTVWISSIGGTFGDQVNGTQFNLDDAIPDNTAQFMIGRSDDGVDDYPFYGQIDDFYWYNGTALTSTVAEAIYDTY